MFTIGKISKNFEILFNDKSWYVSNNVEYTIDILELTSKTIYDNLLKFNGIPVESGYRSIVFEKLEDIEKALEWLNSILLMQELGETSVNN